MVQVAGKPLNTRDDADVDVDVVLATLGEIRNLPRFQALLTDDERARAAAYKVAEPRDVFVLARGLLRLELGRRLECDPRDVRFDVRPSGKPDVRPADTPRPDWRFSVSHTGKQVAIAFAFGADVGLDIERVDREVKPLDIASRYFTPKERSSLESTPESARSLAFFAGWTRKEAVVKARGLTMAESLTTTSVDLDPTMVHPRHDDSTDVPARTPCRLTAFRLPERKLIGAAALCSDHEPRLRFHVLSDARFD